MKWNIRWGWGIKLGEGGEGGAATQCQGSDWWKAGWSEQAHLAIFPAHYLPPDLWKWGGGRGEGATQGAMHTRIILDTQTHQLDEK